MKSLAKIAFIMVLGTLVACGKKEVSEKSLYDQVMDIHDEVMPKMNDLYKMKKQLKDSIANTPDMPAEQKAEFEQTISLLDSASKSMMDWMHDFNPPEPTDKEAFQKYMESELVKVKKMKETVMSVLEKTKN